MQYAYGGDAGLCPRVHSAFNLKELQQFFNHLTSLLSLSLHRVKVLQQLYRLDMSYSYLVTGLICFTASARYRLLLSYSVFSRCTSFDSFETWLNFASFSTYSTIVLGISRINCRTVVTVSIQVSTF